MGEPSDKIKKFRVDTKALVTPNFNWSVATGATVKGKTDFENVTIFRPPKPLMKMTVRKDQFPLGVVILNPLFAPDHIDPMEFPGATSKYEGEEVVPIPREKTDPPGIFIVFEK